MSEIRLLFLGDIVGGPGRRIVQSLARTIAQETCADIVIANGENSAGGLGIDANCAKEILDSGIQLITTGNHVWGRREFSTYLEKNPELVLRPHNYPKECPGKGFAILPGPHSAKLGVVNLIGRVFMSDLVDCPFRAFDKLLETELADCTHIFVDFHCEATSEKNAFGYHVDGRASAVVGTHTHVQTADERILPKGTAFITDVGMCGPRESVIGVMPERVVEKFLTSRPMRFALGEGEAWINAVLITLDSSSSKATAISRIQSAERKTSS